MNNWKQSTLGNLVAAGNGIIQTGPFGSQLHASDYVASGIPCIMPVNLKDNRIDLSAVSYISEFDANRLSRHLVKAGDIIYSRRGDVTQKALVGLKDEGCFCGTGCLLVRPGKEIDPSFLLYFLSSPASKSWIINNAVGITMPNLNTKILGGVPIKYPSIDDQKTITKILSNLDSKIDLNNKIDAELHVIAKTIYDYWFIQFDFPNFKHKPYKSTNGAFLWNEELNKNIPYGWSVKNLGEMCEIYQSKTISQKEMASDGKYFVFGSNGIIGKYNEYNHENSEVVVSCRGNCGNVIRTLPKSWITGNAMVFKIKDSEVHNEFLYQSLQWLNLKKVVTGSVQGQLTRTNVTSLKILVPDREDLIKYSNVVKDIVDKQLLVLYENNRLSELRDWLLPMLMNGQVKVGDAEKMVEEKLSMAAEEKGVYKKSKVIK